MIIKTLNSHFIKGFKKGEMHVISNTTRRKKSKYIVNCKYGEIYHKLKRQSYNMKYEDLEIDVDYTFDELSLEYTLKGALYSYDSIIGFKTSYDTNIINGLIKLCEEMIEKELSK